MTTTRDTVTTFYASLERADFTAMRDTLHDELDVQGPIRALHNADTLVATLTRLSRLTKGIHVEHLFVDGPRACCVYRLLTDTPIGASAVTEYFHVLDGQITLFHAHFDGRPWDALFSGPREHAGFFKRNWALGSQSAPGMCLRGEWACSPLQERP